MSSYSDFLAQDFGSRCNKLMERFFPCSQKAECEVTFLLAIAAAGLVIPHERISQKGHQPLLDRKRFASCKKELEGCLGKRLADVVDCPWKGGLLAKADWPPDDWGELQNPAHLEKQTTLFDVVTRLRNALAHGNIFTRPRAPGAIEDIVFVCGYPANEKKRATKHPLRFVLASPEALKEFLEYWFQMLASLRISGYELGTQLGDFE